MPRSSLDLTGPRQPASVLLTILGVTSLCWIVFGLPLSKPSGLTTLDRARWPTPSLRSAAAGSPYAAKAPSIFATSLGPNAVPEVNIVLRGVAKGPRDQAALVAVGDAPEAWLKLGENRNGVTLLDVESSKIVLDTALGFRTVSLDKSSQARPTAASPVDHRP